MLRRCAVPRESCNETATWAPLWLVLYTVLTLPTSSVLCSILGRMHKVIAPLQHCLCAPAMHPQNPIRRELRPRATLRKLHQGLS